MSLSSMCHIKVASVGSTRKECCNIDSAVHEIFIFFLTFIQFSRNSCRVKTETRSCRSFIFVVFLFFSMINIFCYADTLVELFYSVSFSCAFTKQSSRDNIFSQIGHHQMC